jgi:hypothetical protein
VNVGRVSKAVGELGVADYDDKTALPSVLQPLRQSAGTSGGCSGAESELVAVAVDVSVCFREQQDGVPLAKQLWWELGSRYSWIYDPTLLEWPTRVHPRNPAQLLSFSYAATGDWRGGDCLDGAACCCLQPAMWHIRASFRDPIAADKFQRGLVEGLTADAMGDEGSLCLVPRQTGECSLSTTVVVVQPALSVRRTLSVLYDLL